MPAEAGKAGSRVRTATVTDCVTALVRVVPGHPVYRRMLRFHYWQHGRIASPAAIANAVGFKGAGGAAHLHYGRHWAACR